ncbi:L-Ala-D/L-Glu epimerase [Bacteroidia bacterium]|nr:L-Ala-D/L-Glu epimerase [Bacteroidia bacterium]
MNRRDYLKTLAALTAATAVGGSAVGCVGKTGRSVKFGGGKMVMQVTPIELQMRHTFTISGFSRDVTPSILVSITYDGVTGYGEGGLPPYMVGQNHETVQKFLSKVDLSQFADPFQLDDILTYVDKIDEGMTCAKSAVDIALHDLIGKLLGVPVWKWFGYTASKTPDTSFTIGIDTEEVVRKKTEEAAPYNIVKVKLGIDEATDKKLIETVRSVTNKPLLVDANQGWKTKELALDMIHWLKERGVLMVEQPMPKTVFDDMAWVTERSPLPTYADESCQRLRDVPRLHGVFNGINIKLIKCSGLYEARKMISTAEALGMRVMIGCTTETSCAVSAAAQLSPRVDFADLDGPLLIANDYFEGYNVVNGKITLNERPGIGILPINN